MKLDQVDMLGFSIASFVAQEITLTKTALVRQGHAPEKIRLETTADLRYAGQQYELEIPVADQLVTDPASNGLALSASATGTFAFRAGASAGLRHFVWVDRTGRELSPIGQPDP